MMAPTPVADLLPYRLALALSAGSLAVYFAGAVISRLSLTSEGKTRRSFSLGLPSTRTPEELFAISIVSASTTLSTVFVAFLVMAGDYGLRLLVCPICFAGGTLLAFWTYDRIVQYGYMDHSSGSGLLPRFAHSFTGSRTVTAVVALASALPLLAILVLELRFGVLLLLVLLHPNGQNGYSDAGPVGFLATLFFLIMLLGYVFVGGFRAVVTSDVWQYRIMKSGLGVVLISLLYVGLNNGLTWQSIYPPRPLPVSFYVTIALINIFGPLCLVTSWQRFYAFQAPTTSYKKAAYSAVMKAVTLWGTIVGIGVLCAALSGQVLAGTTKAQFLGILIFIKEGPKTGPTEWFAYFVFPLLVVSAFSGMYSSSDTCVSALLYLTESGIRRPGLLHSGSRPLGRFHYLAMALIFAVCLAMYRLLIDPARDLNLEDTAIAVFGNVVLIAPTVLLMACYGTATTDFQRKMRKMWVLASICAGFATFWTVHFYHGPDFPQRSWATLAGLVAAAIPAALLVLMEGQKRKGDRRARVSKRVDTDAFRDRPTESAT
jgi:hypothetical protein